MSKIRFAIIGPGRVGSRIAEALFHCKNAELWSVYSRSKEKALEFSKKFHARASDPAYDNLELLLSDSQLQAVIISTPDNLHSSDVLTACKFGKHILVEKPLVTDLNQGIRVIEQCKVQEIKLGVGYHLRFEPNLRELSKQIRDGSIGEIHHMGVHWAYQFLNNDNWRSSRELGRFWSLSALGTHILDLIRWYLVPSCGEIVEVKGITTRNHFRGPNDESAMALLRFESGATAEFVSSIRYNHRLSLEVFGSRGSAFGSEVTAEDAQNPISVNGTPIVVPDLNPYVGEIENFADSILLNRDPEVTGEEGLRNLELLLSIDPV